MHQIRYTHRCQQSNMNELYNMNKINNIPTYGIHEKNKLDLYRYHDSQNTLAHKLQLVIRNDCFHTYMPLLTYKIQ